MRDNLNVYSGLIHLVKTQVAEIEQPASDIRHTFSLSYRKSDALGQRQRIG